MIYSCFFNCLRGTWRSRSQETMKTYINIYSNALFLPDNNAFFCFLCCSTFFRATHLSFFLCFVLPLFTLQITREEVEVSLSQKKLHSLQLYHAISWKAWGCDNDTAAIVSQRAQVRGKASKQSGHTSRPAFYITWSIKRVWHWSVIYSTVLQSLCVFTFYSLIISLERLMLYPILVQTID